LPYNFFHIISYVTSNNASLKLNMLMFYYKKTRNNTLTVQVTKETNNLALRRGRHIA